MAAKWQTPFRTEPVRSELELTPVEHFMALEKLGLPEENVRPAFHADIVVRPTVRTVKQKQNKEAEKNTWRPYGL